MLPKPIRELRELTRTRKQLVREISQRIQKTLEDANIKLGSVLSNVLGHGGRAILNELIAGETDPECVADLAQKPAELIQALCGRISTCARLLRPRSRQHQIEATRKFQPIASGLAVTLSGMGNL